MERYMNTDLKLQQLREQENGVLVPALVRQKPDGRYEMVSGHRRKYANCNFKIKYRNTNSIY